MVVSVVSVVMVVVVDGGGITRSSSVSTCTNMSYRSICSCGDLRNLSTVPCVIVGESCGIVRTRNGGVVGADAAVAAVCVFVA